MVVQKLEAQHDAGGVESAGGDDQNIKLMGSSQTNPLKYHTEQGDVFKRPPTVNSSRSDSCYVTVRLQNVQIETAGGERALKKRNTFGTTDRVREKKRLESLGSY